MDKLRAAAQALSDRIAASGAGVCERAVLDDSTFSFNVLLKGNTFTRIDCNFLDPDQYPSSGVYLSSSEDNNEPGLQATLNGIMEKFQEKGPLDTVVCKVLESLGHSGVAQRLARPQTSSGAADKGGDADMADASAPASDAPMEDDDGASGSFGGGSDDDGDAYMGGGSDSEGGGGASSDDDDGEEEDDEEERMIMIECGKRQGRWERFEAAYADAEKAKEGDKPGMSSEHAAARKRQIFDPREAFLMLSRELLDIFRQQSLEVFVDSAGDDVYAWAVELCAFAPGSGLAADMDEVRRRYGYSSVRFTIHFMRGLHPFYPARVELTRPHFKSWALGAVASHPMLTPGHWDALRPQAHLIDQVKAFLQSSARVDLSSPFNDLAAYPTSCYPPSQRCLAQLEALTGMPPLWVADGGEGRDPDTVRMYECRDASAREVGGARMDGSNDGSAGAPGKKRARSAEEAAREAATAGGASSGGAPGATDTASAGSGAAGTAGAAGAAEAGVKPAKDDKTYWARGTGYGHGDKGKTEVWDARASEAAQRARDEQLQAVMAALGRAIAREMGPRPAAAEAAAEAAAAAATAGGAAAAEAAATTTAAAGAPSTSAAPAGPSLTALLGAEAEPQDEVTAEAPGEAEEAARWARDPALCARFLAGSCLLPVLIRELRLTSFTDMCARAPYFTTVMKLARELCRPECAAGLLARALPRDLEGGARLAGVLAQLALPANQYLRLTAQALRDKAEEERRLTHLAQMSASAASLAQLKAAKDAMRELRASMRLALLTSEVAAAAAVLAPPGSEQADASAALASTSNLSASELEAVYCDTLRPLQVEEVGGLAGEGSHTYGAEARRESVAPADRVTRLGREISGLMKDLPLSSSSSVFVRVDDERMMVWRALITGPDDTPYAGGCFLFDLYFPPTYPAVAPQVKLRTTGGGTVRFNPNLYNCGKVCLSLLGTWQGGKGEGWTPGLSTALQVFVSIQSLILVPDPYFNEPGYERTINTDEGRKQSRAYNVAIREACIRYAMLDILRHPPREFAAVTAAHFRLRAPYILRTVDAWVEEAAEWNAAHAAALGGLRAELAKELGKLTGGGPAGGQPQGAGRG